MNLMEFFGFKKRKKYLFNKEVDERIENLLTRIGSIEEGPIASQELLETVGYFIRCVTDFDTYKVAVDYLFEEVNGLRPGFYCVINAQDMVDYRN